MGPRAPKVPPEGPRRLQDDPKSVQDDRKMAPKRAQVLIVPKLEHTFPRCPNIATGWLQVATTTNEMAWDKMTSNNIRYDTIRQEKTICVKIRLYKIR